MLNKIVIITLVVFFTTALNAGGSMLMNKKASYKQSRAVDVEKPSDGILTIVKKFDEKANASIWVDNNSSKIYLKILPITDKIFITNNTHSIRQFVDGEEEVFSLTIKNIDDNNNFFDYVYKEIPKILEIVVDPNQGFDVNKTFDFMFENNYKLSSISKTDNGTQCINMQMSTGWNLLALPVAITLSKNSSDENTSMTKLGNYDVLYTFTNNQWNKNPNQISAGEGFWIKKSEKQNIEFCGKAYSPILEDLNNGWNLVGTGKHLFNFNDISYIKHAYKYKNEEWLQDFNTTNPGEGFWVKIGDGNDILIPAIAENLQENVEPLHSSLEVNTSNITKLEKYKFLLINAKSSDYEKYKGAPLFIHNKFEGLIETIEQKSNDVYIYTKDATSIEEIYENYSVSFDGIKSKVLKNRSLPKDIKVYNYLSIEPLNIKLVSKNRVKRDLNTNGSFVHIDIPKSYKIPIKEYKANRQKIPIPIAVEFGGLGVSFMNDTQWSYLEFELNPSLDLDIGWDREKGEWIGSPYIKYDYEQTVVNNQNINFEVSGKLSGTIANKTFQLLGKKRAISIPIPISAGTVSIRIFPQIKVEVTGELSGKYTYKYYKDYSDTTSINFDSRDNLGALVTSKLNKNTTSKSTAFSLEASTGVSISPQLKFAPAIGISKLSMDLNIFSVNIGYEMSSKVLGVIAATESGVTNYSFPYTKVYFADSFFNPYYLTSETEGQLFISGLIDLTNVPFIEKPYDLKFAPYPKQKFGKFDFGIIPQPEIREITTKEDEKKKLEIYFPNIKSEYLDKVSVSYGGGKIDFSNGESQILEDLPANTTYNFLAQWKKGETTSTDVYKSFIFDSKKSSFTTSIYDPDDNQSEVVGKWTLRLKCIDKDEDASVFEINMLSNSSSDTTTYSIKGSGTGVDYDGSNMSHIVNGAYSSNTDIGDLSLLTSFSDSDYTRSDRFSANLDTNDTGYINTTHSFSSSDGSGCQGLVRLHR